jgi:hypothetical protein
LVDRQFGEQLCKFSVDLLFGHARSEVSGFAGLRALHVVPKGQTPLVFGTDGSVELASRACLFASFSMG